MWSSKALPRAVLLALALTSAAALSACSGFTPVYSGALSANPSLNLAYAKPNSRIEQIIYQELALRLGKSEADTAPLASVRTSLSYPVVARSITTDPRKPLQVILTAILTIQSCDGTDQPALTLTRRATAYYSRTGQVLADNAAAEDATERAAKAAAESLRLAVLAELSRR